MRRIPLLVLGLLLANLAWAASQSQPKNSQPPPSAEGTPEKRKPDDKDLAPSKGSKDSYTSSVGGRGLNEWMTDLKNADPSVRERAIRAVAMFGPLASQAIPILIERTNDKDGSPRIRAVMALGMMDLADRDIPKVVEALVRRISSEPQAVVRYQAMISLSRFQPIDAKAAIAPLAKEVEDQNTWEIRKLAVSLLTSLGYDDQKGPDPIAMRGLITALKDPAIQVKQEAVFGLATIGRPADQALATNVKGAFTTLINNSDKGIAIWANVGLINLEKPDGKLLANITKHLSDPRADVRVLAARALGTLGKLAEFTIPELTKALTDPEPEVQVMAIWALAMMGSSGSKALPNLRELADNKKTLESVKQSALMAIGQISGKPDGTLAPKILTPKDGKAPEKGS
jgi:hypothetical protein